MSFREFLNEIQRTGSKTDREEYSGEKEFYRLKKNLKLLLSENQKNKLDDIKDIIVIGV